MVSQGAVVGGRMMYSIVIGEGGSFETSGSEYPVTQHRRRRTQPSVGNTLRMLRMAKRYMHAESQVAWLLP